MVYLYTTITQYQYSATLLYFSCHSTYHIAIPRMVVSLSYSDHYFRDHCIILLSLCLAKNVDSFELAVKSNSPLRSTTE